ncbi:7366_t:CDS:2, partial [Gigaspora rosea]
DPEIAPDLDPNHVNYHYIVDAIGGFIFAAMGTTANGATRALYDLVERKQKYWQELYQEAQEINKQCNGNELTSDDIAKMVKLDSFVKETLRLSSGIVGSLVMVNFIDTNNDEELQGQNPTEFYAYRHLERNSPAIKLERNFLSFGGGKHACPGRALAVNEIKVFLHKVMLKYDIKADTEGIQRRKFFGPLASLVKGGIVFENRKEIIN